MHMYEASGGSTGVITVLEHSGMLLLKNISFGCLVCMSLPSHTEQLDSIKNNPNFSLGRMNDMFERTDREGKIQQSDKKK